MQIAWSAAPSADRKLSCHVRFAAGRDKLMVVLPGEKVIQRYDLRTFQREKAVPVPEGLIVAQAKMGYDSQGPLALWGGGLTLAAACAIIIFTYYVTTVS